MKVQQFAGRGMEVSKENVAVSQYEMAVRYQQTSAEVHALQIQGYNLAKMRLDKYLKGKKAKKEPAIVIDLDETVLDNMPFVAMGIEKGFDFTKWDNNWQEWIDKACAELIPGAKAFLNYADKLGFKIFYVSNRLVKDMNPTLENLKKHQLPQVSKSSVLLKGELRTKKERRNKIREKYEIVLLIGNSLYDLSSVFINESTLKQIKTVDKLADKFGDKFIILPNAAYGDYWVNAKLNAWKRSRS